MNPDPKLKELLGEWDPEIPACERHPSATVAGFCSDCGKPVCAECAMLSSKGIRCVQCVPAWQAKASPATREAIRALHAFFTARRTIVAFAGLLAFAAVLVFSPAILRPSDFEPPPAFARAGLRAPYLEKAYRLRIAGDTLSEAGDPGAAAGFYRRAEEACRTYLSLGGVPADQEPIVQLGLGRLQEKQGQTDKAMETYIRILTQHTQSASAGVAAFYVGRILEAEKSNTDSALGHYRQAYALASRGAASAILDYHVAEQEEKTHTYAVAALLDTATHPRAYAQRLAKAIERLSGKPVDDGSGRSARPRPGTEVEETLEIVIGR